MAATITPSSAPETRAQEVLKRLGKRYAHPTSALTHHSPWELLVATVLAAQCTDERVNKVTPELFRRWPDPAALGQADVGAIEEVIHSTGFFRNKAKNLKATGQIVANEYGGELPKSLAELTKLPGVARKTANIILGHAFGINEGVAVDTHVKRLSFRLGFTESQDVKRIERDLMAVFPQDRWGNLNHYLVFLGREVCKARSPQCPECPLEDICPKNGV
ncbi:endonuclease III [Oceanidesulfovibrio marinus]|uniref:Endonuclease III n=1 Tax=Oceanidesulfovibrio marinus TaxID=370038 RepID=A0A6P1ZGH1_9BACT|nr:endonuclease III [Oceanidesulfovibrio marinus]QJT10667.1 endonuclease III [Oceanidesulfovibrio marinus]TVM34104.1 endonuclease III [Oceanidesulfovibrio marinus]